MGVESASVVVVVVVGWERGRERTLGRVEGGSIGEFGRGRRGRIGIVGGMGLWCLGMRLGGGGGGDGVACSIVGDAGRC